jgi:hypothetical protein
MKAAALATLLKPAAAPASRVLQRQAEPPGPVPAAMSSVDETLSTPAIRSTRIRAISWRGASSTISVVCVCTLMA